VIEALNAVDEDRKCFTLIGGVLVEKTVKEVLPSLQQNRSMVSDGTVFNSSAFI
jgi:prefoldin subunit 2